MMMSEETKYLLDKVVALEQTLVKGKGLSQTEWFKVQQQVINRIPFIEKHKDNREQLIRLLTSVDRRQRVNHLIQELDTLKLMDTLINLHSKLPLKIAAYSEPHKKHGPSDEGVEIEECQHNKMLEQLQNGLQDYKDLFPVLTTAIQEDSKRIFSLQAKADYLLQELSVEDRLGFWEPTSGSRQSQLFKRKHSDVHPVNKRQKQQSMSDSQVKQSAADAVISKNIMSSPEQDFKHKAYITDLDLNNIQQTKETLKNLKQLIDKQDEDLSKHSTEDLSEWESKLELLSKEILALSTHSLITDVIGDEVLPEQCHTPDILKDPASSHQRLSRMNQVYQLRQFQYGKLTHNNIQDILHDVILENMETLFYSQEKANHLERVYGSPVYIVTEYGSPSSSLVSCPVMKLDQSLVNTDYYRVSTDGRTLDNRPDSGQYYTDSGQYNTDRFRWYCGTFSSPPILLPPSPSTLTIPRYWESHSRLSKTALMYGRTVLEMGVCCVEDVDKEICLHKHTRSSWCVRLVECDTHRHSYCTQVWGEGRQVGECYNTKYIPHKTTVVYKYGVVLDVEGGRIVFLDVDRDIVIEKMDVRITQTLIAMFGVTPGLQSRSTWDIEMGLVSGGEIDITDNKQSLIYKALSM